MEVAYTVTYNLKTGVYTYTFLDHGWWNRPVWDSVLGTPRVSYVQTIEPLRVYPGDVIYSPEPLGIDHEDFTPRRFDE